VVDLEVKSEQVQCSLTKVLLRILDINEEIQFLSPSFSVNFLKVYPVNNLPKEFLNQNGSSFKYLTSFGDLIQKYQNEIILIKVRILKSFYLG